MRYEVEQKFPCRDLVRVREQLLGLGAIAGEVVVQSDCYYRHPVRDFGQTDEAFRLRRVGDRNYLTYKGPKVDASDKTRIEQEVRLADGADAAASCHALVCQLGFRPVATVTKQRQTLRLVWERQSVEVALDEVDAVGQYVELEVVAAADDASVLAVARSALAQLATSLGLAAPERRSYLELLLAAHG